MGESGLLSFFLGLVKHDGISQPLKVQTLRIIGNSCADTGMLLDSVVDVIMEKRG
jgi:hypothetical protein